MNGSERSRGLGRALRLAVVCALCAAWALAGCSDDATGGAKVLSDTGVTTEDTGSPDGAEADTTEADATEADATEADATEADATPDTSDTTSGCVTDCDCPQGEACLASGQCIATAQPTYCCDNAGCPLGQACTDGQGQAGTCAGCRSHCDCPQGQVCGVGGECIEAADPVYCCDSAGCPSGEACTDAQGQQGACPACANDCDCPQGQACTANGECIATAQPTYCCDNAGCPAGEACVDAQGASDTCPGNTNPGTCADHCDCPQGQDCNNGTCQTGTLPKYCCDNAGCPANQVCQDAGGGFGLCPPAACTKSCDCDQGQTCNNGQCRRGFNATYCCDKVGCPGGESCVDSNSQVGTCPVVATSCTSTADCAPRGAEWVCDVASSRCYVPGRCDGNDSTIAPCAAGSCNFLGVCECDPQNPSPCRTGEQCTTLFPNAPSACTAF